MWWRWDEVCGGAFGVVSLKITSTSEGLLALPIPGSEKYTSKAEGLNAPPSTGS